MKIETPSMSENGRTYFNTEEEKNKTQNYFEKTSENKMVEFYFLFDGLLKYMDFDISFTMQLTKTSKFSWNM